MALTPMAGGKPDHLKPGHLQILYRGPLASCNYACPYCPFAKRRDSREALRRDAAALGRFVQWVEAQKGRRELSILFTPWGEALIRQPYREALARLSRMAHVRETAIQTNLSCSTAWIAGCAPERTVFWCSFHPGQTALAPFLAKCASLQRMGVRYSVGAVGAREHFAAIAALRRALPPDVYVWINALAPRPERYYSVDDIAFLAAIDPLFELNLAGANSLGRPCLAGQTAIAVDGEGEARRCHFVPGRIGSLYEPGFDAALAERPCPNARCVCHIGYAFMPALDFASLFGESLAHRIPARPLRREDASDRLPRMAAGFSPRRPLTDTAYHSSISAPFRTEQAD